MLWVCFEDAPSKVFGIRDIPEEEILEYITPQVIAKQKKFEMRDLSYFWLSDDKRNSCLPLDVSISSLHTSFANPLVVRFQYSDARVDVHCSLLGSTKTWMFEHTTGIFFNMRENAQQNWPDRIKDDLQYYFGYKKKGNEYAIENVNHLRMFMSKMPVADQIYELHFSIQFKDKKPYSKWSMREVFYKILKSDGTSILDISEFNTDEHEKPIPDITDDDFKLLINELQKRQCAYQFDPAVKGKEATWREFISCFLTTAVKHLQSKVKNLVLKDEEWLEGSFGYGPIDYIVFLDKLVGLLAEAKEGDFNKGAAQNIVQIHTAVELLGKTYGEKDMLMHGIVTNASSWYFIRWTGSLDNPKVERSKKYDCDFKSLLVEEQAKKIVFVIVSIIAKDIDHLKNLSSCKKARNVN